MQNIIEKKLTEQLNPQHLIVENESHLHAGHAGSPGTGNSHFKITIKSSALSDLNRVKQHQKIYQILDHEIKNGIHALSINVL